MKRLRQWLFTGSRGAPLAATWLNGMRAPPAHISPEIRAQMIREVGSRLKRSRRYWIAMLLTLGLWVPLQFLVNFMFIRAWARRPTGALALLAELLLLNLPCYIALILTIRRVIRPIIAGIVDLVWWEHSICPRCDYDIKATPNRCPECGTIPPTK